MGVKKIVKIPEKILKTISGIIPTLLNVQVKIEGAEWDPESNTVSVEEINIDFNLGKKV
jgi:hypothetical protein